jgi:transketolase
VYVRLSARENSSAYPVGGFVPVRQGRLGVVVAVGPTLDAVLEATSTLDVTVLYAGTVRPFDHAALRDAVAAASPNVVLVEPYLAGTSAHEVAAALDVPHRLRSVGVRRDLEVHAYGTAGEHDAVHGLDAAGIADVVRRTIS